MVKLDLSRLPSDAPEWPDTLDWPSVLDQLLLGVSHSISNRVATLSGVSDILSGDPTIPPILRALADEVPRLEEGIRLLRLLAVPDDERDEALEATRAVDDAISLVRLHSACRNISFEMNGRRDVPPVIARPTVLTHKVAVALVGAAMERAAGGEPAGTQGEGPAVIRIGFLNDGRELVISAGSLSVRARLLSAGKDGSGEGER